jgi:DNA-binding NtrC family response regulator
LKVPPLRERPDDIPLLARHMLESARGETVELAADAMRALCAYAWPGNVRELRNVLERAVLLSDRRMLTAADLRLGAGAAGLERDAGPLEIVSLEENERRYLARVLEAKNGRVDECARALGVPLSSLYQRLKRHGVGRGRA